MNKNINYLYATLDFTKRFGTFRQEFKKDPSHPLRRGRYFIMKTSVVPKCEILQSKMNIHEL